jgi:GNAT superfamily N-acetyltransferase
MSARPATPDDADELVRLRAIMLQTFNDPRSWNDEWRSPSRDILRKRLAGPSMAAFVVDRPDGGGLAACAVGIVEERLGSPGNPSGRFGYVFNVSTDPSHRRRGYSRACMESLLEWFRSRGVGTADLRASADGEPLYADLGFVRTRDPAMRMRITRG